MGGRRRSHPAPSKAEFRFERMSSMAERSVWRPLGGPEKRRFVTVRWIAGNKLNLSGKAVFEAGEVDETPPEGVEVPLPLGQVRSPKGSSEEETRAGLQVWRIDVHW